MLEVAEFGKCVGKSREHTQIRLAGPAFPRGYGTTNPIILIYNCYICILLINTTPVIYICCILYEGARGISGKGCAHCWRQ